MNTRVRLILLSLIFTLLVVWLPTTSYAKPMRIKGHLVSHDEQKKTVEIKLTSLARYDGDTIGTVHLKGLPPDNLSLIPKLKWGKYGSCKRR